MDGCCNDCKPNASMRSTIEGHTFVQPGRPRLYILRMRTACLPPASEMGVPSVLGFEMLCIPSEGRREVVGNGTIHVTIRCRTQHRHKLCIGSADCCGDMEGTSKKLRNLPDATPTTIISRCRPRAFRSVPPRPPKTQRFSRGVLIEIKIVEPRGSL